MRRSSDFSSVVRDGLRGRADRVVVHHLPLDAGDPAGSVGGLDVVAAPVALVGFVVSKAVGGSVVRHRVSRRLRARVAARVSTLPAGSRTVVRALPLAASASSAELDRDLQHALSRVQRRLLAGSR